MAPWAGAVPSFRQPAASGACNPIAQGGNKLLVTSAPKAWGHGSSAVLATEQVRAFDYSTLRPIVMPSPGAPSPLERAKPILVFDNAQQAGLVAPSHKALQRLAPSPSPGGPASAMRGRRASIALLRSSEIPCRSRKRAGSSPALEGLRGTAQHTHANPPRAMRVRAMARPAPFEKTVSRPPPPAESVPGSAASGRAGRA